MTSTDNVIAKALRIIAALEIIGGIIIFIANYNDGETAIGFYWFIGGIVLGIMFLGFAEVIALLTDISNSITYRPIGKD